MPPQKKSLTTPFRPSPYHAGAQAARHWEDAMPDHVYKHLELTGSSTQSADDAVRNAIARASKTMHNLQWFQVLETRGHIKDGKVAHWQVTLKIGFTLDE